MQDSDQTHRLLDQFESGDSQAFATLFARHRRELRDALELRMEPRLRRRLDPSDVIQETQLETFQRFAEYLQLLQRFCPAVTSPSQIARRKELTEQVRRAISQLRDSDREILVMRYIEGLSNNDIGLLLDLQPSTVSKRHGRALLRLQHELAQVGITGAES